MKSGFTFSWPWALATGAALVAGAALMYFASWQANQSQRRYLDTRAELDRTRGSRYALAEYTPESVETIRARVDAVSKTLVPANRATDYSWLGKEWTLNPGPVNRKPGYAVQPLSVERPGAAMSDWGVILRDLERWEAKPGVVQRTVAIRAGGPDSGRFYERVSFSFDVYIANNP